ncbi:MAG: cbb3-type cytochrome c oxidase subunit I [Armatimonadota bacterium]
MSSAAWFLVAALWGMASAMHLFAPDLFRNVGVLEFGRMRPAHTNLMLFGFTSLGLIGGGLYVAPVMLRTPLFSERLANLAMWLWNLALVVTTVTLPIGLTQGREYAELVYPAKLLLLAALVVLLYVLVMTVMRRQESLLYVSVWYICGAVLWTTLIYPLGNVMWHPRTGALFGTVDAIWLWFYGHNIFGLLLTPLAVGMAYYIMPRVAKAPLYSHTLSLVGFWALLAFYTHIGTHHLIQAPVPTWLKTVSIVDSIGMLIPVTAVLVNLWLTTKDRLGGFLESVPGKFVFAGSVWYLITCVQGPMQSLPSVQTYTHFNNWVIGHAHIAVAGFSGSIALGTLWYVLPLVSKRRVYSVGLVNLQFWLFLIGIGGFFGVLTAAGLIQGAAWANGETVYRALPLISPYMGLRALFGVLVLSAALVGLYNVVMTLRRGEAISQ